jgi:hypothetical protein
MAGRQVSGAREQKLEWRDMRKWAWCQWSEDRQQRSENRDGVIFAKFE